MGIYIFKEVIFKNWYPIIFIPNIRNPTAIVINTNFALIFFKGVTQNCYLVYTSM